MDTGASEARSRTPRAASVCSRGRHRHAHRVSSGRRDCMSPDWGQQDGSPNSAQRAFIGYRSSFCSGSGVLWPTPKLVFPDPLGSPKCVFPDPLGPPLTPSATPWCGARVAEDCQRARSHSGSDRGGCDSWRGDAENNFRALSPTCLTFPCRPRGRLAGTEAGVPLLTGRTRTKAMRWCSSCLSSAPSRGGVQ